MDDFPRGADPRLAAVIREEWPRPPSFDTALAMIGGPPDSPAAAALAEAIAAVDRNAVGKENGDKAPVPAKEPERPLDGEIRPPPAKKRRRPSADGTAHARRLLRQELRTGPRRGSDVEAAAEAATIPKTILLAAADALGVKTRRGEWRLPG